MQDVLNRWQSWRWKIKHFCRLYFVRFTRHQVFPKSFHLRALWVDQIIGRFVTCSYVIFVAWCHCPETTLAVFCHSTVPFFQFCFRFPCFLFGFLRFPFFQFFPVEELMRLSTTLIVLRLRLWQDPEIWTAPCRSPCASSVDSTWYNETNANNIQKYPKNKVSWKDSAYLLFRFIQLQLMTCLRFV